MVRYKSIVDDALKLTVDQVFPRKKKLNIQGPEISPYKVKGYSDIESMWEYLHQIGIVKGPAKMKAPPYSLCRLQQNIINTSQRITKPELEIKAKIEENKEEAKEEIKKESNEGSIKEDKGS